MFTRPPTQAQIDKLVEEHKARKAVEALPK